MRFFIFIFVLMMGQSLADDLIPGPRDCFWSRGPFSGDPYINVAYPDANVYYWATAFSTPEGSTLEIKGDYPYSRYMSFFSYDEKGRPIGSLTDYEIKSDSTNPFVPGNQRSKSYRAYTVEVVNANSLETKTTDDELNKSITNILYTPQYKKDQQLIVYRVYLPDKNTDPTGGVKLPQPILTLSDGTKLADKEACKALNASQPLQVSLDALGIPPDEYIKLINQPEKPDTWPSHNPTKWFIQLDRNTLF